MQTIGLSRLWTPALMMVTAVFSPATVTAQVREVIVGVTPSCPYGIKACWAGAYEALGRMEGVRSVSTSPDAYNCTATVRLEGKSLPDPKKWADQFKSFVDQSYVFRGVEVTVEGELEKTDKGYFIRIPEIEAPLRLGPLLHKLQWNSKKASSRQPEPDEKEGYDSLVNIASKNGMVKFQITGPICKTNDILIIEVREFFPISPPR